MKWSPDIISGLFLDNVDYKGLLYYYNDIHKENVVMEKEIQAMKKRNKKP